MEKNTSSPNIRVVHSLWKIDGEYEPPKKVVEIVLFDTDPDTGKELTKTRAAELQQAVRSGMYFTGITEVIEETPE